MMKKFYSLALVLLSLFSCVLFSACGDKYKNLDMRIYSNDGEMLNSVNLVIDTTKSSNKKTIGIEFLNIDEEDVEQIVVYSLPFELVEVSNYIYSGNMCYVDLTPNMPSGDNAKLIVSHLASGKKKEFNLKVDKKSTSIDVVDSTYIISIPKEGEKEHFIDFSQNFSLYPMGSTDKIFFKTLPADVDGVEPIKVKDIEGLDLQSFEVEDYLDTYVGFKVSSSVEDGEEIEVYPVTYMKGYEDASKIDDYSSKVITIRFKHTLSEENVQIKSSDEFDNVDLENLKLIANDITAESFKLSLHVDGKTLQEVGCLDIYNISLKSQNSNAVTVFTDKNGDIVINSNIYTEDFVDVSIELVPKYVGDIETVEKIIKVKGESKSDNIEVTKNGELISVSDSVNIFDYYEEGNSLGALFKFKPYTNSGAKVNENLEQMQIVVDPSILSEENYLGTDENVKKLLSTELYALTFHHFYEVLSFTYVEGVGMVSSPINETSRVYIKYVDGKGTNEPANFGIKVQTINSVKEAIEFMHWANISSTEIEISFNRLEGVQSMTLEAGTCEPIVGEEGKYEYKPIAKEDLEYIYLDRTQGLDSGVEKKFFVHVKNYSVEGVDGGEIAKVDFSVEVQSKQVVANPLKLFNGLVTNSSLGENKVSHTYINNKDEDVVCFVFNSNTSLGDYDIIFKQENIERARVIVRVYQNLNGLDEEMINFETNKTAFKNSNIEGEVVVYTYDDYESDYIVASNQDLDISLNLPSAVLNSDIVEEYEFDFKIVDASGNEIEESESFKKLDYFDFKHDSVLFNNALLKFKKGTYFEDANNYVELTITVKIKQFENIVEISDEFDETNKISVKFFIYEQIEDEDISINHAKMTRYYDEYLGVYYKDLSRAELQVTMTDDLWHYVTGENRILWSIDNEEFVEIDNSNNSIYSLIFNEMRGAQSYSRTVKAYVYQFDNVFELQCVFTVKKPILTEKIIVESPVDMDNGNPYINLKMGEPYQIKASNYSPLGKVTNAEIIIQVVDKYGLADPTDPEDENNYFDVNQTNSTITVKKVEDSNKMGFKLIVFARDTLDISVTSDRSGYNNPSMFFMNNFRGAEQNKYINGYAIIDIVLSDGTEDTPYLIKTANDFWEIDDTEEFRKAYYELKNVITLNNTTDTNLKIIQNFEGTIKTNGEILNIDGIYLDATTRNLFTNFSGTIENIRFVVNYNYDLTNNANTTINLGLFDENNGSLTNVGVEVSGKADLKGSGKFNFGGLVGENKSGKTITYSKGIGSMGSITLQGNADVNFGGLVGENESAIIGAEEVVAGEVKDRIVLSANSGRTNALSQIEINSTLAGDSVIGGVVGLNSGTIQNAYVQAIIDASSTSNVGGVIGKNIQTSKKYVVNYTGSYIQLATSGIKTDITNAIYNVKSASKIIAKNNVGGIVGYDEYGLFVDCDYQILLGLEDEIAILGQENVGGIAGLSQYGKFAYCSVMSYRWNYKLWKEDAISTIGDMVADISAGKNVGGVVGFAVSDSVKLETGDNNVSSKVIVVSSSVNATLASTSEDATTFGKVAGILSSNGGISVLYNVYFIGQVRGDFNYTSKNTQTGTEITNHSFVLDNDNSSLFNIAYSLNVDISGEQAVLKTGAIQNDAKFDITKAPDLRDYPHLEEWAQNSSINGGYVFVKIDENGKPIYDVSPDSINVTVKGETNEKLKRVLNLTYYDFTVATNTTDEILTSLNEKYNQNQYIYKLQEDNDGNLVTDGDGNYVNQGLLDIVALPTGLGAVVVSVYSTNTTILDITFDGRIIVYGVGECELVFNSVLNPEAGNIENRTIKVVIDYPIGDSFNVGTSPTDESKFIDSALGIAMPKGTSKQFYAITSGEIEHDSIDYSYKTKTNLGLKVDVKYATTDADFNIAQYVGISGLTKSAKSYEYEEDGVTVKQVVFTYDVNNKTPFIISVLDKLESGYFEIVVTPYSTIEDEKVYYIVNKTFKLSTNEGVSAVAFSYDEAIVYPNDVVSLNAFLSTDKAITDTSDILNFINILNVEGYRYTYTLSTTTAEYKVYSIKRNGEMIGSFTIYVDEINEPINNIQKISLRIEFSDIEIEKEQAEEIYLEVQFKLANDNYESVLYTILPQRINKIEVKNYYNKAGVDTLEDILKPNAAGLMIVDIVPNNGYYSYLEVSDITGSEEILFLQVDENKNVLSVYHDPSSDGKGIKLYHYEGLKQGRIYILTQIDNRYSSKMHTVEIRAYSSNKTLLASARKYIDVRMLPEITATYLLPDGSSGEVVKTAETREVLLANGVDANIRIQTINSNGEVEPQISSSDEKDANVIIKLKDKYELKNISGNLWTLHRKENVKVDDSDIGKTITIKFSTYAYMDNGDFDVAECSLVFKIESFVVHGVSVNSSIDNANKTEIYGYFDRDIKLNFYFDADDISFYHPQDGQDNFWSTEYIVDNKPNDLVDGSTLDQIYDILDALNEKSTNSYLKIQKHENGEYKENNNPNVSLSNNKLSVKEGYKTENVNDKDVEVDKYLTVEFKIYKDNDLWKIATIDSNALYQYNINKKYLLNFTKVTAWDDPEVVTTEEEFKAMSSGGTYILKNDITLKNYVPLDVNLGYFDGNGHTITINSFGLFNDQKLYAGLFSQVYENMIVKNVKVKYQSENGETGDWSFGFVGDTEGITYADLCNNKDVAYTEAKFGGIAAINNGIITNCVVEGLVAFSASTLEQKTMNSGGNYAIDFVLGGMVAENSSTGYITHSTTELSIYSLANIGGFVHTNKGKIASCGVEKNSTIYGYNVSLGNTIVVQISGFVVENSNEISMSYVDLEAKDIEIEYLDRGAIRKETIECGKMSAKDISAGFVYRNSGDITDAYVQMTETGRNNNSFAGFVYSNSGVITRAYTYIDGGTVTNSNNTMFAQAGATGFVNCLELVNIKSGYSSGIASGLKTVPASERFMQSTYETIGFAFGNNSSAIWMLTAGNLPQLVSTKELKFENFRPLTINQLPPVIENGVEIKKYETSYANYGTKNNPFLIYDLETWNNFFSEEYNKGIMTGYYRIIKDIDFSKVGDNPQTSTITFSGNIQGNNMKLTNVMLYSSSNLSSLGLFGMLEGVGDSGIENSVRNLTISATSVWASSTESVGVLAGIIQDFNIYNVTIDAEGVIMVAKNAVGGLAGVIRGELDIDLVSSNIGANSTRASTLSKYSVYMSKNNSKNTSANLSQVYYAGSIAGIVDGYNKGAFRVYDVNGRDLSKTYYNVRNISVSGDVVITGDTVGVAFGFVGERVRVKYGLINVSGSVFGSEYSSGLVGENRGVIELVDITLADNIFAKSKYVSSGAVGFNLGGLVRNVNVKANIIKTEYGQMVSGVVGRNVYGTVSDVEFDGELFAYFTGGILAADYDDDIIFNVNTGSGALSDECKSNANLIPTGHVKYLETNEIKHLQNVSLSSKALKYMLDNSSKYYTYKNDSATSNGNLEVITVKGKVLGMVVGLSYKAYAMTDLNGNEVEEFNINYSDSKITFNSSSKLGVEYGVEEKELSLQEGVKFKFNNYNFIKMDLPTVKLMYIIGSTVTSFDTWSSYSDEYLLFGNI